MTMPPNTVSVIGAEGMLGRAVVRALKADAKDFHVHEVTSNPGGFVETAAPFVINCAGKVRGREDTPDHGMAFVNAYMPHILASRPNLKRMVTVSTDCVFNGASGPYHENSQPTPTDLYSRTKLAGEIPDNDKVLTVRTSFIGFGVRGLLRWFLTQPKGAKVEGYNHQLWNGFYVYTVACALVHLCLRKRLIGLLHLVGEPQTKARLLRSIGTELRPDITVEDTFSGPSDLTLISHRCDEFDVGVTFDTSMAQLYRDYYEWGRDYLCSL